MTDQHRATPDEWAVVERANQRSAPTIPWSTAACLLELRARVEALEKAQRPVETPAVERVRGPQARIQQGSITLADALAEIGAPAAAAPAASLVERVQRRLFECGGTHEDEARAAIREVAAWLRENDAECEMGGDAAATADLLDEEADR